MTNCVMIEMSTAFTITKQPDERASDVQGAVVSWLLRVVRLQTSEDEHCAYFRVCRTPNLLIIHRFVFL